jgi:hypothetical protein
MGGNHGAFAFSAIDIDYTVRPNYFLLLTPPVICSHERFSAPVMKAFF